ncbi:uncharacterized protein CBL_13444 [Carabus blaptoides fortunei]
MTDKRLVILSFIVILFAKTEGLKCYTCTVQAGSVDQRCVTSPGSVETGSPITNCDKDYCVAKRVEFKDPPGKIQSFYRNCENKPTHMNTIITDDFFITYYTACRKDYCNGGNGKDMGNGGNFDDGYGGYGVLRVPAMATSKEHEELEVFDSWEDMDKTEVLERKLKEILPRNNVKSVETNSCTRSSVNVILYGEDALRSQYVAPEPTVRILKRPSKNEQVTNGDAKPKQPIKTLKQREQEYAEARLRILGEAHSSEKEERISIQNKHLSGNPLRVSGNDSNNVVIRSPRGPDGTKGFTMRR